MLKFTIEVYNTAPRFTSTIPTQTVTIGATSSIYFPMYMVDDEGNSISMQITGTLYGFQYTVPYSIFKIPTSGVLYMDAKTATVPETHTITVKIYDGQPLYS